MRHVLYGLANAIIAYLLVKFFIYFFPNLLKSDFGIEFFILFGVLMGLASAIFFKNQKSSQNKDKPK